MSPSPANRRDRILVVDDDPGMRRALHRILAPEYDVTTETGATGALARFAMPAGGGVGGMGGGGGASGGAGGGAGGSGSGGAGDFALALVDVRLGDGDGYSLCQAIREASPETDVILITGSLSQPDEKLYRSLEEGAFYFLFKPFDRRVLLALVERCLRLQRERAAKESFGQTLAADLERARRFQHSLLPRDAIAADGWRIEGRLVSCDALGGDLYLARDGAGGLVWAVIDVVGHGVSAAMYAGMLRSTLDAARRRSPEPRKMIGELLDGIDFFEAAKYATLFYGLLLPDGGLRYINAGHPAALWQHGGMAPTRTAPAGPPAAPVTETTAPAAATASSSPTPPSLPTAPPGNQGIDRLPATGFFLSTVFRDRPHSPGEIVMRPGDRLLVYTDGASEACGPEGAELGAEGLAAALDECRELALTDALDFLLDRVRSHCAGRTLDDDVTLLLIERTRQGG